MYGSMEQSTAAAAPALGPEEVKFVRKLMATNGDDARSAGLSHESQASSASTLPTLATQVMSASTLAKLEAASDEVELQPSVWDSSLFLFNPVAGRSASVFAFLLLDQETLSSTYPDFFSSCGELYCGNTCCVPPNGTALALAPG